MDFSEITPAILTGWYRFALLLTGDPREAEAIVLAVCLDLAPALDGLRGEKSRQLLVLRGIRERSPGLSQDTAQERGAGEEPIVATIAAMPEPTRSAIALFYLKLLSVSEIAALLKLSLEDLGETLAKGRAALNGAGAVKIDDGASIAPVG